jgi:hypothetical protein
LQGLARHGLLDRFDYLSTVSGGGFIGGWLSAWVARVGIQNVIDELKKPPESPLKVESEPVEHLRIYSNYLSPQPGLLSADTVDVDCERLAESVAELADLFAGSFRWLNASTLVDLSSFQKY